MKLSKPKPCEQMNFLYVLIVWYNPVSSLQDRYVCAVTRDVLGNSVPCAVLRHSWVPKCQCVLHSVVRWSLLALWGDNWHILSCVQGNCGDTGVCGEIDQEGHDWSCYWRQTIRQRHHTTAEGKCVLLCRVGGKPAHMRIKILILSDQKSCYMAFDNLPVWEDLTWLLRYFHTVKSCCHCLHYLQ